MPPGRRDAVGLRSRNTGTVSGEPTISYVELDLPDALSIPYNL